MTCFCLPVLPSWRCLVKFIDIEGLGLMNAYILGLDLSAMGFVLLFFALSMQLSILFRAAWQVSGINSTWDATTFPFVDANRLFNI